MQGSWGTPTFRKVEEIPHNDWHLRFAMDVKIELFLKLGPMLHNGPRKHAAVQVNNLQHYFGYNKTELAIIFWVTNSLAK